MSQNDNAVHVTAAHKCREAVQKSFAKSACTLPHLRASCNHQLPRNCQISDGFALCSRCPWFARRVRSSSSTEALTSAARPRRARLAAPILSAASSRDALASLTRIHERQRRHARVAARWCHAWKLRRANTCFISVLESQRRKERAIARRYQVWKLRHAAVLTQRWKVWVSCRWDADDAFGCSCAVSAEFMRACAHNLLNAC